MASTFFHPVGLLARMVCCCFTVVGCYTIVGVFDSQLTFAVELSAMAVELSVIVVSQ